MKAVSISEDSDNIRLNAKSTYTNDRRDDDTSSSDNDGNTAAEDEGATSRDHDDGAAYVIDRYAVVDSCENAATSLQNRPDALRKLGDELNLGTVAAAETALR